MRKSKVESIDADDSKTEKDDEHSYEDFAPDFFVDYDRANPVTAEKGYEDWVELI
jgi:hypothetical protein